MRACKEIVLNPYPLLFVNSCRLRPLAITGRLNVDNDIHERRGGGYRSSAFIVIIMTITRRPPFRPCWRIELSLRSIEGEVAARIGIHRWPNGRK